MLYVSCMRCCSSAETDLTVSVHSRDTVMSVSADEQQNQQREGYALDFCFEPHKSVCARDCCNHSQEMQSWHFANSTLRTRS